MQRIAVVIRSSEMSLVQVVETSRVLVPALLGAGAMALPTASADGDVLHAAQYPWSHDGVFSSYDTARYAAVFRVTPCLFLLTGDLCAASAVDTRCTKKCVLAATGKCFFGLNHGSFANHISVAQAERK